MMISSLLAWWYGAGLKSRVNDQIDGLMKTVDFFSVGLLIKTLFAPFRQIDAGRSDKAPLDVRVKMFFDRLLSRFIGAGVRTVMIVAGLIVMALQMVVGFIAVILHITAPMLPIFGLTMMLIGWVPAWPF